MGRPRELPGLTPSFPSRRTSAPALVLSRFAGAAQELDDALIVNPYDTGEVANAIHEGLAMGVRERRTRWRAMMARLKRHDVHTRSEEHTSELQSLMRISYAVFCLNKKIKEG